MLKTKEPIPRAIYPQVLLMGDGKLRQDINGELKNPFPPSAYRPSLTRLVVPGKGGFGGGTAMKADELRIRGSTASGERKPGNGDGIPLKTS